VHNGGHDLLAHADIEYELHIVEAESSNQTRRGDIRRGLCFLILLSAWHCIASAAQIQAGSGALSCSLHSITLHYLHTIVAWYYHLLLRIRAF
jgi:hypothetical protein